MGDEPIGQREFDQYARATDRRLEQLERWRDAHEKAHNDDDDDQSERRRWSWQQVVAWVSAAAVLGAAWLSAAGK